MLKIMIISPHVCNIMIGNEILVLARTSLEKNCSMRTSHCAAYIFVLCGFWHNFRQFLGISRTPPRTVRACIEASTKNVFSHVSG